MGKPKEAKSDPEGWIRRRLKSGTKFLICYRDGTNIGEYPPGIDYKMISKLERPKGCTVRNVADSQRGMGIKFSLT